MLTPNFWLFLFQNPFFNFSNSPIPHYKWQILFPTHANISGSVVVLPLDFLLNIVRFSSSYHYRHIDLGTIQLQFNFLLPTIIGSIFFFLPLLVQFFSFYHYWQIGFELLFLQNSILDFLNYWQIDLRLRLHHLVLGLRLQHLVCVKMLLQYSILDISDYCLIFPFHKLQ